MVMASGIGFSPSERVVEAIETIEAKFIMDERKDQKVCQGVVCG